MILQNQQASCKYILTCTKTKFVVLLVKRKLCTKSSAMVEVIKVTRADVVKVECGVGDDNAQGSPTQQTSTKRKRSGVEQLISACENIENTQTKSKLPSLSWDEKYKVVKAICDFIHEELQKEKKKNNEFNYNPDVKMKLLDFVGRPAEICPCRLSGRIRKLSYKDAIVLSNGENWEEEEVVMHKAAQIRSWLKNLRRTGQHRRRITKKQEQLLKELCFDVLSE